MLGQDAQGVAVQTTGTTGDSADEQVASVTVGLHTAHGDHLTAGDLPSVIEQTLVEFHGHVLRSQGAEMHPCPDLQFVADL